MVRLSNKLKGRLLTITIFALDKNMYSFMGIKKIPFSRNVIFTSRLLTYNAKTVYKVKLSFIKIVINLKFHHSSSFNFQPFTFEVYIVMSCIKGLNEC